MLALLYLFLGLIPPMVAGPLAGVAFIEILKRRKLWVQLPFWALLIVLNVLVMFWVASSSGLWFPIASLPAFFGTPVAAIFTVFVMRNTWQKLGSGEESKGVDKGWFTLGIVLIPMLQIGMFAALLILAPWLCKVGLFICQDL